MISTVTVSLTSRVDKLTSWINIVRVMQYQVESGSLPDVSLKGYHKRLTNYKADLMHRGTTP